MVESKIRKIQEKESGRRYQGATPTWGYCVCSVTDIDEIFRERFRIRSEININKQKAPRLREGLK